MHEETMAEFGPSLDRLGLDELQVRKLIEQAMAAGAADPDQPAGALRELGLRVLDGSTTVARGLAGLGLDAAEVTAAIAAGGFEAKEAVGAILDELREVDDRFWLHQIAVDLFGVVAEDLGDALFAMEVE